MRAMTMPIMVATTTIMPSMRNRSPAMTMATITLAIAMPRR